MIHMNSKLHKLLKIGIQNLANRLNLSAKKQTSYQSLFFDLEHGNLRWRSGVIFQSMWNTFEKSTIYFVLRIVWWWFDMVYIPLIPGHALNTHNTLISRIENFLEYYEGEVRHSKIVVSQNILHDLELHFDKTNTFSLLEL